MNCYMGQNGMNQDLKTCKLKESELVNKGKKECNKVLRFNYKPYDLIGKQNL